MKRLIGGPSFVYDVLVCRIVLISFLTFRLLYSSFAQNRTQLYPLKTICSDLPFQILKGNQVPLSFALALLLVRNLDRI